MHRQETSIQITQDMLDALLEQAAQRGAERGATQVLARLGLENGHAAGDVRELRSIAQCMARCKAHCVANGDQACHYRSAHGPVGRGCTAVQMDGRAAMMETLLGGLLGGAFRLAPELLKALDRKGERQHELDMQDKALEFEKLRGAQRMQEIGAQGEAAWSVAGLQALQESIAAQGQRSGVRWVDALSCTVRPVITYWFMGLYCAAKTAAFALAWQQGFNLAESSLHIWSESDQAMWAGVLNFWFLGRVLERKGR